MKFGIHIIWGQRQDDLDFDFGSRDELERLPGFDGAMLNARFTETETLEGRPAFSRFSGSGQTLSDWLTSQGVPVARQVEPLSSLGQGVRLRTARGRRPLL